MKYREYLNRNNTEYIAKVYEHDNKVVVGKYPVVYRAIDVEWFEFNSLLEYELWLDNQSWVKSRTRVSKFKNVKGW